MADWLRPVFARTKTPVPGFSDRQSSFSADDKSEDGDISRLRPTSRVSSYMNIRSSTPPIHQTPDSFANIRSPESVYHKPSVDHMAETLKVVMMNQSSMDPVPIAYNACILHVLEAYQDLSTELVKKENFLEDLKLSHTKDIHDFEALATQWEMKERDYKTEMKKLEVLLSRTEGGMEKVTLARSKSAVHGSGAAERIKRGIGTIKERNSERNHKDSKEDFTADKTVGTDATNAVKQSFHPRLNVRPQINTQTSLHGAGVLGKRQFRTNILRSRGSSASQGSLTTFDQPTPETLSSLMKSELDAFQQQQVEGEYVMASDSSTSGPDSSTQSSHDDEKPYLQSRVGFGIDIDEKPLPKIPSNQEPSRARHTVSDFGAARYPQFDSGGESVEMSPLGFSFKPGDDTDILTEKTSRDLYTKSAVGTSTYQPRNATREQSEESYTGAQSVEGSRPPRSAPLVHKSNLQSKPGRDLQESEELKRDDSTSSIITAVRVDSRRSSVDSSRHSSQSARQRLNRNSGCNEAVTAAIRALAIASAGARASPRKGSSSGTREGSLRGEESPRFDEEEEVLNKESQKASSARSGV